MTASVERGALTGRRESRRGGLLPVGALCCFRSYSGAWPTRRAVRRPGIRVLLSSVITAWRVKRRSRARTAPLCGAFNAPRETRTPTEDSLHKALNLASGAFVV